MAKAKLNVAQLEVAGSATQTTQSSNGEQILFDLIENGKFNELLKENSTDHIHKGISSPKFNAERELQINNGIDFIASNKKTFLDLDPKILALAKFWENKTVRGKIKDAIYKEADEKGLDGYDYMVNILGAGLENVENLLETINRMKYAIRTYYKPRVDAIKKGEQMIIDIEGTQYSVDSNRLKYLKNNFSEREELIAEILKVAKKVENVVSI